MGGKTKLEERNSKFGFARGDFAFRVSDGEFRILGEVADSASDVERRGAAEKRRADGNVVQAEDGSEGECGDAGELHDVADGFAANGGGRGAGAGGGCSHEGSLVIRKLENRKERMGKACSG
jgi:hypothetical protein